MQHFSDKVNNLLLSRGNFYVGEKKNVDGTEKERVREMTFFLIHQACDRELPVAFKYERSCDENAEISIRANICRAVVGGKGWKLNKSLVISTRLGHA